MSNTHFNQTNGPLPLDGGRVLAPGEPVELTDPSPHDQALEDERKLGRLDGRKPRDPEDLTALKRDELDQRASVLGHPAPEDLPNKTAVIEAIEDLQAARSADPPTITTSQEG